MKKHILIEPMLFGDYKVNVWDESLNSLLDKEYFCRGMNAAINTAVSVKTDFFPELEILIQDHKTGEAKKLTFGLN